MTDSSIKVWDPFVRLSHWVLAVSFLLAFFTHEDVGPVHVISGYIALGTAALRILWGFVGPRHARFSDFVCHPKMAAGYLFDLLLFRAKRYIGHSPAGGLMVVALLAAILVCGITGVLIEDAGMEFLEEPHEFFSDLGMLLVVLHLAGVALASVVHRENLVRAMVNGRKRSDQPD